MCQSAIQWIVFCDMFHIFVQINRDLPMNCRIITLIFLLSALFGCDKFAGVTVTETFNIENTYSELYVSNAINVVISDTAEEVKVTAGENLLPNVIIEEKDDILDIRLKDGTYFFNSTVNIELPVNPNLTELTLSDASDIEGDVNAQELTINLRNASDAKLKGYVKKLTLNLKDASGIKKNIINSVMDFRAMNAKFLWKMRVMRIYIAMAPLE